MDEKFVSFLVFESVTTRMERTIKRLWITNIILITAILVIVGGIIYYNSQWESVETTEVSQDIDTGSGCATITAIGDITQNESTSDSEKD